MVSSMSTTVSMIPRHLLRRLIICARELAQALEGEEAREVVALVMEAERWMAGEGQVDMRGDDASNRHDDGSGI